ncbi:hypothetical protein JV16_02015 [Anoxybacillus ayderensis]|uniref:Uncharacterized protein n=1 Tax=Anoxybacillus ayderensis TaxID=265546 RepID=A0A0D0GY03_9BACL|nr:hypothetical protein JV16_02015 [Anoxybacillus ayderensis]
MRQCVFRHGGRIGNINPFLFDLCLLHLFLYTGQHLGIPRLIRQVAVVYIAIKRNAILVANQPKSDLLLPTMMPIVAMRNLQGIQRCRFIRTVNRYIGRIGMEHPKRDAFFLVNLHKTGRKNRVDIGVVQSIQMARDGIVVEPGRGKPWSDQLRQIDVVRPSFHMNECLPTTQNIQGEQPDHIAGSGLALRIHRNKTVDQRRETKILENGAYYI